MGGQAWIPTARLQHLHSITLQSLCGIGLKASHHVAVQYLMRAASFRPSCFRRNRHRNSGHGKGTTGKGPLEQVGAKGSRSITEDKLESFLFNMRSQETPQEAIHVVDMRCQTIYIDGGVFPPFCEVEFFAFLTTVFCLDACPTSAQCGSRQGQCFYF